MAVHSFKKHQRHLAVRLSGYESVGMCESVCLSVSPFISPSCLWNERIYLNETDHMTLITLVSWSLGQRSGSDIEILRT